MKNLNSTLIGLVILLSAVSGQDYLIPSEGYKATIVFPDYITLGAFDLHVPLLYANDGDTIHCLNLETGLEERKFGRPAGYDGAYASFITVAPDGKTIWAGYTVFGNSDDRIYRIDVESGEWKLQATLPGNFDLEFWNDSLLVSGLNSTDWTAPSSIFLLDTSGSDQHRKIVEAGGYAAGITVDGTGNLYYGTSYAVDLNAIYRWDSTDIAYILGTPGTNPLIKEDGEKLTDLPSGANDCEVDAFGNLIFTFNDFTSSKVLAQWNGTNGDGQNFDTLSVAPEAGDWLGMVKSQGNINTPSTGNRLFTNSPGRSLTDVHLDYLPILTIPLPVFSGLETENDASIDLSTYFTDPDDPDDFSFEVVVNTEPSVASVSISEEKFVVNFLLAGQTNVVIKASNADKEKSEKVVVGVQPVIMGEYLVSDFEELTIDPDSFWNGADGSGGFTSGEAYFYNDYNADWFSWSGWAYSNVSDNTTPGFLNQYSAIPGNGFDEGTSEGSHYGVGYVFGSPVVSFKDSSAHEVAGIFITNSTYSTLSMEHGDLFSKKFGGEDGNDPDYFKLMIWGDANGASTDSIEFYLSDYRFEDNTRDYLIKTWQWVDLGSLGRVDSLMFALESTDVGKWGMNTPAFFCIDNLYVIPNEDPVGVSAITDATDFEISVYPNPNRGRFIIGTSAEDAVEVKIFNLTGSVIFENRNHSPGTVIDISHHPAGSYIIRVTDDRKAVSKMFIQQ